jgi:hypothetical protein
MLSRYVLLYTDPRKPEVVEGLAQSKTSPLAAIGYKLTAAIDGGKRTEGALTRRQ